MSAPPLRRCPKCRSAALVVHQVATVAIHFEQTSEGFWRRIWGAPQEEPAWVDGECRACGHEWRMPGIAYPPGETLYAESNSGDRAIRYTDPKSKDYKRHL